MIKIQIKSRIGSVLFEYEKEKNTIKDTLIEAVKSDAILCDADLRDANLCGVNLCGANLRGANLRGANLRGAILCDADLRDAILCGVNLCGANLCDANLRGANFRGADLCDANLCDANLRGAILCDAKEIPYIPFACPSEGAFIGWKKVYDKLVKLEIPKDAKRCSCTSNKCRCDKAKVLRITSLDESLEYNSVINRQYAKCEYKVGEMVYPDSFDENRWKECSHGIHFFINKQDAINY